MPKKTTRTSGTAGLPTDAQGNPAIDPTANVLDKVESEVRRIDDLREASERYQQREADLRERWRGREADIQAQHEREQRRAEAARIDANRATDLASAASTAAAAVTAVQALAKSTVEIAETARINVTQSAAVVDANFTRRLEPIERRLDEIQRVQTLQLGAQAGTTEQRDDRRASVGLVIGVASGVAVYLSIVIAAVALILKG
jgi:hypothetical protein